MGAIFRSHGDDSSWPAVAKVSNSATRTRISRGSRGSARPLPNRQEQLCAQNRFRLGSKRQRAYFGAGGLWYLLHLLGSDHLFNGQSDASLYLAALVSGASSAQ